MGLFHQRNALEPEPVAGAIGPNALFGILLIDRAEECPIANFAILNESLVLKDAGQYREKPSFLSRIAYCF